ncbi:fimbrial protein [Phocaeicola barnesiae]|uniref:fimbrial protein n=1 Tax=Phocaeicola barnesiae TaxID=376804 RepID=UPI0025A3A54F|nr:DUF4906 domain-containing protein [Phocaeicola barnesiae]MDM8253215.1 DUF4906 domain-containing protein [Phocaeicola barnesiae]
MNTKRILHTWSASLLFAGAMLLTLVGCMDDDLAKNNGDVVEGVPITVTMKLAGAPTADVTVDTRASDNDLSTLSNLTIYVFDGNGTYQQTVSTLDGFESLEIINGPTETSDVTYEVKFETTSGTKKLLAVGNSTSSVWSEANNINVSTMNFEELKKHLANLNIPLNQDGEFSRPATITSDGQMMITGKNEGIQFDTNGTVVNWGESKSNIAVKMKRMMAHVTFNITQPDEESAKGTFIPTSYKVYNVPTKACLVNMDDDNTIVTGENAVEFNHFASTTVNPAIDNVYSFDFYMPENIYGVTGGVNDYQLRDKWTVNSEKLLGKQWTYAPQTSTFVVISGTYSGNSTVDDDGQETSENHTVTGNVQYTIHLGDFSDSKFGDYSIARNVSYTYNVSVEGVNKIVVEALTNKEDQPGAEGQIFTYDGSTYSYELDAHYEQLFLEYNLSSIASAVEQKLGSYNSNMEDAEIDNAIADNLILVIQSEAMDYTHNGSDYTVQNKRGTLRPYQIYADAVRSGENPANAKNSVWQGSGSGIQPTGGFDYQWIEFWPQESGTSLAAYPGVSEWSRASTLTEDEKNSVYGTASGKNVRLKDVYDVIVAMGKAVKNIYKSGSVTTTGDTPNGDGICIVKDGNNYVARFTAFVNEYYYYEHPLTHAEVASWDVFVNKIPREMIIAMSSKISEDGNSSYSQVYSYITQRSMETFYNSRATAINGFGIETYNETPLTQDGINFTFGSAKCTTGIGSDLSDTDGRSNQIALIGIDNYRYNRWDYYISTGKNGWFNSTNTNHKEHKLSIDAYSNNDGQRGAYAACLSRNRDLNGDGTIDESEVRWFLPSVNEYLRIGIGSSALSNAAQLYIGNKASLDDDIWYTGVNQTGDKNYVTANNLADGTLFYTSSIDDHRTYWAVEKGSYGKDQQSWTANNSPKPIRCIRVLPTNITSVDTESDATYEPINDPSGLTTLKFKDRLVDRLYRNGVYTSLLSRHNEDGDPNFYSEGIFVASKNVKTTNNWGEETNATFSLSEIIGYDRNGNEVPRTNPCKNHREGGYSDGWRVPNLVELMAMNAEGLVDNLTICCTAFSRLKVRYGFKIDGTMISCPGSKGTTDLTWKGYLIRCVRDVPAGHFDN